MRASSTSSACAAWIAFRWRRENCSPLIADLLPYSAYGKNYLRMISRPTALERYFEHDSPHFLLESLLQPEWMPPGDAPSSQTLAHCLLPNGADVLTQALYFEATAKLTGDMLVKVDRMSMANSLEVRCPMLDHKLAELAAQIPHAWKLRNGRGKDIFIQALGDRLPPELLRQPKRGFGVPLAHWFRGSLRSFLWDHLTSAVVPQSRHRFAGVRALPAGRARSRTPQQLPSSVEAVDAGVVVPGLQLRRHVAVGV